jgi:hypothetical protein
MKLDRYFCEDCVLTHWVLSDDGFLMLMCPRCGRENPFIGIDTVELPYGVPMLVADVVTGRGAKRSTANRSTRSISRKEPRSTPTPITAALKLGGKA